jgi:hypothetical protein
MNLVDATGAEIKPSFEAIVKDLMEKQAVIQGLHRSLMAQKEMAEHKIKEFSQPFQAEIDKLDAEIQDKLAHYKAECKKHFGIADGDKMNVVETLVAFKKAIAL